MFFISVLSISVIISVQWAITDAGCTAPLGMIDGRIKDWQLSSSSWKNTDSNCHVRYARIHSSPGLAWCPYNNISGEYLQIDLGVKTNITALLTQGRADGRLWVRSYVIAYSNDAINWSYYNDGEKLLGNRDSNSVYSTILQKAIFSRFIRIEIVDWHFYPALRLELLGCQQCNSIINYPPRSVHHASSERFFPREKACEASEAFIDGGTGWCSKWNNQQQWLTVDVGPPTTIVGVITRGRGSTNKHQWVTAYSISYSNDSRRWNFFKDVDINGTKIKEFGGNMDSDTRRWHYFEDPIVARYIRFNPISWKMRIAMRVGVIGCLTDGNCPSGFIRINNDSECVINLSYHRSTWINDKRHLWSQWTYGHSDLAVDGHHDDISSLNKCAILDNYFVETPIWMVDLGNSHRIMGLIVISWPGHYTPQNNLSKLVIKVANTGKLLPNSTSSRICGEITYQQLIGSSRIHVSCSSHLIGQYVYIAALSNDSYSQMLFSAILCEVFVY